MYRQVLLSKDQTKFHRIWWRRDSQHEPEIFELTTLTYGTAPASFLPIRCLHELANIEAKAFPIGANVLRKDFYVDDLLTGANDISSAIDIYHQITQLLAKGGFEIRKWASNSSELLKFMKEGVAIDSVFTLEGIENIRTLGVQWNPNLDQFQFDIPEPKLCKITKRNILSKIAGIYDPLGLVGPTIVIAKLLMQDLWRLELNWDESVPSSVHTRWINFITELQLLKDLRVNRHVLSRNRNLELELHGLCDASEEAYGACVYIRYKDMDNNYQSHLLCSKSRLAPLRNISLPRLELCGALLLANLMKKVKDSLSLPSLETCFWSDSTIVLTWIKRRGSVSRQVYAAGRTVYFYPRENALAE